MVVSKISQTTQMSRNSLSFCDLLNIIIFRYAFRKKFDLKITAKKKWASYQELLRISWLQTFSKSILCSAPTLDHPCDPCYPYLWNSTSLLVLYFDKTMITKVMLVWSLLSQYCCSISWLFSHIMIMKNVRSASNCYSKISLFCHTADFCLMQLKYLLPVQWQQ